MNFWFWREIRSTCD